MPLPIPLQQQIFQNFETKNSVSSINKSQVQENQFPLSGLLPIPAFEKAAPIRAKTLLLKYFKNSCRSNSSESRTLLRLVQSTVPWARTGMRCPQNRNRAGWQAEFPDKRQKLETRLAQLPSKLVQPFEFTEIQSSSPLTTRTKYWISWLARISTKRRSRWACGEPNEATKERLPCSVLQERILTIQRVPITPHPFGRFHRHEYVPLSRRRRRNCHAIVVLLLSLATQLESSISQLLKSC